MKSPTYHPVDISSISLGERRGKSDLARFSLDLGWAREVPDIAPSRAYPSPPMSGSPPIPPRRNPESSDRGHGSYTSSGQDVFRGSQISQPDLLGRSQAPSLRGYQEPLQPAPFVPYRLGEAVAQVQYQQQSHMPGPLQQPHPHQHAYVSQPPPFGGEQSLSRDPSDFASGKVIRKTKGHVASACVPCKRAHLRCDAQRPCSRCLSNGKEDACVDVVHKKRGRPRLRDEREPRYEGMGPGYHPPERMSRPMSMYASTEANVPLQTTLQRSHSNPYRVLKSQPGMGGPSPLRTSQYLDHASAADANIYPSRGILQQEHICAYLTMDMQIAKASRGFAEMLGVQSVTTRKLHDIVGASDRDKVFRLQSAFENIRRDREPNYLPPIAPRFGGDYEMDRAIGSVGFGPDELRSINFDHHENITFAGTDGQQRNFRISFGLAKKESTFFIGMLVNVPTMPQIYQQSPTAYSPYPRDPQYGFQSQPMYQQTPSPSYLQSSPFGDPRADVAFRTPGPLGQNIPQSSGNVSVSTFAQQFPRPDYTLGQVASAYQIPRSELPQAPIQTSQAPHQRDLQLAPIRDQGTPSMDPGRARDERGRLDIGGLIDKPESSRRSQ